MKALPEKEESEHSKCFHEDCAFPKHVVRFDTGRVNDNKVNKLH